LVGGIAGGLLGAYLFPIDGVQATRPDVQLPGANPGAPLPIVFGIVYVPKGELSWADEPTFDAITQDTGIKGSSETTVGFKVFLSFGVIVCEGPATILKIWRNGDLVYGADDEGFLINNLTGTLRLYDGSDEQEPDPKEEEVFGEDDVSAHPGTCYMVLEDHDITDGFPVWTFLVTRIATPNPPWKKITRNGGDFAFSNRTDDGVFTIGWDTDNGNVIYKINNLTKEYEAYRHNVTEIDQQSGSDTSPSSPQQNNGPPAIDSQGDFYIIQTISATPGEINVRKFDGETLELLDSSGTINVNGGLSGRGQTISVAWTGFRMPDGPISESIIVSGGDEVRSFTTGPITTRWSKTDSDFESLVSLTLRVRPSITPGPDGQPWVVYVSSGGNGDPLHVAFFKLSHVDGKVLFSDSITLSVATNINLGHVAWYQWDLDAICVVADGRDGFDRAMVKYFPADGSFEEVGVSAGDIRFHSNVLNIQGYVSGLADSTVHWIGEQGDNGIFNRWDWTQMAFVETCNVGDTPDPQLTLTPGDGWRYDELTGLFQLHGISAEAFTWFIGCKGNLGAGTNLCEVTEIVGQKVGYDITTMLNCEDVRDVPIDGAIIAGPSDARDFLEILYRVHGCYLTDAEGYQTWGRHRGGPTIIDITSDEIGAHVGRNPPDRLVNRSDRRPKSLPRRVELSFQDTAADYQQNVQGFNRAAEITESVDLNQETYPGAMSVDKAKELLKQRLKTIYVNSTTFETSLPPFFWLLTPGDIVSLDVGDLTYTVEVSETNIETNGITKFKSAKWDGAILNNFGTVGQVSPITPQPIVPTGVVVPEILDIPLLVDSHENTSPVRYVGASISSGDVSVGVVIQISSDNANWSNLLTVPAGGLIPRGSLTSALAATSTPYIIDKTNTVEITYEGTLTSAADEATFLGDPDLNVAIIKSNTGAHEILRYQTATAGSGNAWSLSNLLRGQRNTENHMTADAAARIFFPAVGNLSVLPFAASEVGVTHYFRALPIGGTFGPAISHTPTGRSKWPYSPVSVDGVLDGSPSDWDITFQARSRFEAAFAMGAPPIGEDIFSFECDVLDSPGGNVVLTIDSTTPLAGGSFIVTNQDDTRIQSMLIAEADMLGSPGSIIHDLHLEVYQMSDVTGRGEPAIVTLTSGSP
jgi:hypothetical protein